MTYWHRQPKLADWEAAELVARWRAGASIAFLADWFGITKQSVYNYLDRHPGRRGLCAHGSCPVQTPREYCYYHARSVS